MTQGASVDVVLRGGSALNVQGVANGESCDIAFAEGRILAVGQALAVCGELEIDCTGALVSPGLIDLHTHVYFRSTRSGIDPQHSFDRAVAVVNDAGSAGSSTFDGFRHNVIDKHPGRVTAFINASAIGIADGRFGELRDRAMFVPEDLAAKAEADPDAIKGIKVRLSRSHIGNNPEPLLAAVVELAERLGLPVMVHVGDADLTMERTVAHLRRGDILTHCYTPNADGTVDDHGQVLECVLEAQARGVMLDVGHGTTQWEWDLTERALASGLVPNTISSDQSANNINGPSFDLLATVSKMIAVGMTLDDALDAVTVAPAIALRLDPGSFGPLAVNGSAAVSVIRWSDGAVALPDALGVVRSVPLLRPEGIVYAGKWQRSVRQDDGAMSESVGGSKTWV